MVKNFSLRSFLLLLFLLGLYSARAAKSTGDLANLVCFVRFHGENEGNEFERSFSSYEQLFNDETSGANSVYNYFREASYGQLSWKSSFFPQGEDDRVVSYEARQERGYYRVKGEINTIGYEDEVDRAAREQALIREIAEYLSTALPDDTQLDADGDGVIDNLCIVLSGRSELGSSHLLWPHRSDLALPDEMAIYIKDKRLTGYLMVFDDANGWSSLDPIPLNTGVLCHEMSHSLGTYDLYHVNDDLNPVGVWDLMSDNLQTPQHMSAYTKYRYCGWIDDIPEISEPGTYVLNPVGGATAENVAYKIRPIGSEEYFVVEYRRKEGTFDSGLPESGLLVYRINPAYTGGNVNYNGTTRLDEVYIFRPGGTTTADGNINQAAFSAESGRTAFGGDADVKPFYSDGTEARFALTNISSCGETISFDLVELEHRINLSETAVTLNGQAGERLEITVEADVDWTVSGVPEWLSLTPVSGEAGQTVIVLETLSDNESAQAREAEVRFSSPSDASVETVLTVRQQSTVLQPPADVTARVEGTGVVLEWTAPQEGTPLLSDGFEDTSNPNGWTLRNVGDRGWTWQEATRYYVPYNGNYSLYMREAWVDEHQDEWLISPVFANGQTLTFYSKSIAPQKNVQNQFYYVKVSIDGGENWTSVYDLIHDCDVVNQYVKITIDLSAYQSEQMRVAFHAYDETGVGLSYWWQIDDVVIYSAPSESLVSGYAVYRDGVKIGETAECSFVDEQPLTGEHTYTVRATGSFGETSDSDPVSINYRPDGVEAVAAAPQLTVLCADGHIRVQADRTLRQVKLLSIGGQTVRTVRPDGERCDFSTQGLSCGLYLIQCWTAEDGTYMSRKVIVQ